MRTMRTLEIPKRSKTSPVRVTFVETFARATSVELETLGRAESNKRVEFMKIYEKF